MKIQSKQLLKYTQQKPTSKRELHIYRSKSGNLSMEVTKHRDGIRGAFSGLAQSIRHWGKQRLSDAETAAILQRAAKLQEQPELGEQLGSGTISSAAKDLISQVQEYGKDKDLSIDLKNACSMFQRQALIPDRDLDLSLVLPSEPTFTNPISPDQSNKYQIAETIIRDVEVLRETSSTVAKNEDPNGASGMLATAVTLTTKTNSKATGDALSDLWRSIDKVVLIGPEGGLPLIDGPKLANERDRRLTKLPKEERRAASDQERGVQAKLFLQKYVQADPNLTDVQRQAFMNLLEEMEPTEWNSNEAIKEWGSSLLDANEGLPKEQQLPASFFMRLRVLSQDFSTGLFHHATRLEHTRSVKKDGIIFREDTTNKRFEYRMRNDGRLRLGIKQDYQVLCQHVDWDWEHGEPIQTAHFSLTGICDFKPDLTPEQGGYACHDLELDPSAIGRVVQRDADSSQEAA